jgi:hypothetical protein
MTNTIHVGVWERNNGALKILGTQSVHSINYQHDRKRKSKGNVESTNVYGRGYDSGMISPRSIEIKRQILT